MASTQKHRVDIMKNEQPRIGWMFLDVEGNLPMVAWECYRGVILPAKCYPDIGIPALSLWFATMLENLNSIEIKNEFQLENIRTKLFPHKISRLTGLYHFSDKLSATKFAQLYSSSDNHFHNEFLTEIGFDHFIPYSTYDSEWITHYRQIDSTDKNWMIKYWAGEPCLLAENGPIWECLTYTPAMVYGIELRTRAYQFISQNFPDSLAMLELSRLAATGGFMAGHSVPYILLNNRKQLHVNFLLRVSEFEHPDFLEYLANYNGPKNINDLNMNSKLVTPDFSSYCLKVDAHFKDLNGYFSQRKL